VANIPKISSIEKRKPAVEFVPKITNQSPFKIMFTEKTYLICPKIRPLFLDGTHAFGRA